MRTSSKHGRIVVLNVRFFSQSGTWEQCDPVNTRGERLCHWCRFITRASTTMNDWICLALIFGTAFIIVCDGTTGRGTQRGYCEIHTRMDNHVTYLTNVNLSILPTLETVHTIGPTWDVVVG